MAMGKDARSQTPVGTEAAARNHELLFVGTHEHAFDKQSRVTMPAEFRQQLEASGQRFLYSVVFDGPTLAIYPESEFEKLADQLADGDRSPEELLEYQQQFFANAHRLECAAQGRISLPAAQVQQAGLGREVVLLGMRDHIEIRDRAQWAQHMEQRKSMLVNPMLMKVRKRRAEAE